MDNRAHAAPQTVDPLQISRCIHEAYHNQRIEAVNDHAGEFLTVPKGVRHRTRPGGDRSVNLTFEKLDAETVFE